MSGRAEIQADIEAARDETEYLQGFTDFSQYVASDLSLSIYRKFSILGARNLLYLQTELQLLELELNAIDREDKTTIAESNDDDEKIETETAARSWEVMCGQAEEGDETQTRKLQKIYEIRKVMEQYENALLRRNQVLQLEAPADTPFKAFKTWFRTKRPLWGSGFRTLHDEDDMVSLGTQVEPDRMSSLIHRCLGYRLRVPRKTPKSWGPMYYYPVQRVTLIVVILSMLCSASLLVGAIMTLYFVKPIGVRLGIVGIFTLLFAASIALLTHARRVEVYGATAAYAAVLVVFISVNN
ncbi:hypothetical protein BKA64DRAFT_745812 [Cadophora sp. MPI-SDFR-AT-0126]|nr:hypothetical protein BKA64DRAFT_745812 [Leotiomycetes sp. MPI-SDFR-AT-0126]